MHHQYTPRQVKGFWTHVDKSGECWLWHGHTSPLGYGRVHWLKRWHQVHRVSYELHHGAIPDGLCVLHSCDVRNCVNPAHLFLGTQIDNIEDMLRKGRHVAPAGAAHTRTHLTDEDVRAIRRRSAAGEGRRDLAAEFRVSPATISHIAVRRTWRHLE